MSGRRTPATLGRLVRRYRHQAGMTQTQLATAAGMGARTIQDIEADRVRPRPHSVDALVSALRMPDAEHPVLLAAAGRVAAPADLRVSLEVLSPFVVRRGKAVLEVGGPMQRLLLGFLALQPGRVVSRESIVDVLWDGDPPPSHVSMLHAYVSRPPPRPRLLGRGRAATGACRRRLPAAHRRRRAGPGPLRRPGAAGSGRRRER